MSDPNAQLAAPPVTPAAPGAPVVPSSPLAAPPPASASGRPEWLPEAHWDSQSNGIKPEFGQHYSELAALKQQHDARAALIPASADDYKLELKLPETVQVPEGFEVRIDEKDPRVPKARAVAKELGLDQNQFNRILALDAEIQIAAHTAEMERVKAEDAKLGENGATRKEAISNWAKGLLSRNEITPEEHAEILMTGTSAAGVSILEKLMAKAIGTVPGAGGLPPAPPARPTTVEQRWYGGQKG